MGVLESLGAPAAPSLINRVGGRKLSIRCPLFQISYPEVRENWDFLEMMVAFPTQYNPREDGTALKAANVTV